jgi:hypothetical protein
MSTARSKLLESDTHPQANATRGATQARERFVQSLDLFEARTSASSRAIDLHVWCIGLDLYSVIVTVVAPVPQSPEHYKALLPAGLNVVHAIVEVHGAAAPRRGRSRTDGRV